MIHFRKKKIAISSKLTIRFRGNPDIPRFKPGLEDHALRRPTVTLTKNANESLQNWRQLGMGFETCNRLHNKKKILVSPSESSFLIKFCFTPKS